jgi:CRP/FNR family transcriptional regulator, cyclic AMP receptor protein
MGRVRILELDPGLGGGLDRPSFEAARSRCTAQLMVLGRGSPAPAALDSEATQQFGFLVVNGVVLQRLQLVARETVDLLGPGDVARPWTALNDVTQRVTPTHWQVLERVKLAALDRVFLEEAAPWPELSAALADRVARPMRSLLLRLAVAQIPQLETRLRVVLWDLADRFGRVGREGVLVPLQLRHDVIAGLVSASRAAVSRKLSTLEREGALGRDGRGWWLYQGPPAELFSLEDGLPTAASMMS